MSRTIARFRQFCARPLMNTLRAHPGAFGAAVLAAVLLVPVAAIAFPVDTGSQTFAGSTTNVLLPTSIFTAATTVTCMVTSDVTTSTQSVSTTPSGIQVLWPLARISGALFFGGQGAHVSPTVLNGYYRASSTQSFTVSAGQTAQFGCRLSSTGTFANSGINGTCTTTYVCL